MVVATETVSPDMAKKRKTESPKEFISSKKRKLDVDTDDDISIIENDAHDNSGNTKSNSKIHKNSEDDDCLIVHDDMQTAATSQ